MKHLEVVFVSFIHTYILLLLSRYFHLPKKFVTETFYTVVLLLSLKKRPRILLIPLPNEIHSKPRFSHGTLI